MTEILRNAVNESTPNKTSSLDAKKCTRYQVRFSTRASNYCMAHYCCMVPLALLLCRRGYTYIFQGLPREMSRKFPSGFHGKRFFSRSRADILLVIPSKQFPKKSSYPVPIQRVPGEMSDSPWFPFLCRKITKITVEISMYQILCKPKLLRKKKSHGNIPAFSACTGSPNDATRTYNTRYAYSMVTWYQVPGMYFFQLQFPVSTSGLWLMRVL